jgi:hypothetical protein
MKMQIKSISQNPQNYFVTLSMNFVFIFMSHAIFDFSFVSTIFFSFPIWIRFRFHQLLHARIVHENEKIFSSSFPFQRGSYVSVGVIKVV